MRSVPAGYALKEAGTTDRELSADFRSRTNTEFNNKVDMIYNNKIRSDQIIKDVFPVEESEGGGISVFICVPSLVVKN